MGFAVIWRFRAEDQADKVLIGHPGSYTEDEQAAKEDGRKVLSDAGLEFKFRDALMPLAVAETTTSMEEEIQELEEVEIGDELLFYDITSYSQWAGEPWWPK